MAGIKREVRGLTCQQPREGGAGSTTTLQTLLAGSTVGSTRSTGATGATDGSAGSTEAMKVGRGANLDGTATGLAIDTTAASSNVP